MLQGEPGGGVVLGAVLGQPVDGVQLPVGLIDEGQGTAERPVDPPLVSGEQSVNQMCIRDRMCNAHDPWFHSIPTGLLTYVGDEEANQWERELQWNDTNPDFYPFNEGMNIENFIIDFQISKEAFLECVRKPLSDGDLSQISANEGLDHVMTENEYYNKYSFTDEQIDACLLYTSRCV